MFMNYKMPVAGLKCCVVHVKVLHFLFSFLFGFLFYFLAELKEMVVTDVNGLMLVAIFAG